MTKVILASASPRRRELLTQLGLGFTVVTSDIIEDNSQNVPPCQLVMQQARDKAVNVAAKYAAEAVIIGADTIVVVAGQILGKPANEENAYEMLKLLSDREHEVITGIAVVKGNTVYADYVITRVQFKKLTDHEISRYVATGEPLDKAGAYAIQGIGALLVKSICGCYANVVGLPLYRLSEMLKEAGVTLL